MIVHRPKLNHIVCQFNVALKIKIEQTSKNHNISQQLDKSRIRNSGVYSTSYKDTSPIGLGPHLYELI